MSDDPAYMNTTASIAKVYPYPPSQGETEGRVPSLSFHLAGEGRATRRLRLRPTTVTTCQSRQKRPTGLYKFTPQFVIWRTFP